MTTQLTFFAVDFRAKTLATLANAQEWKVNGRASGLNMHGSFASYDLDTSSWKTSQLLPTGGLTSFSGRWPTSGMMRNGECSARPMSALPIIETGFGSPHIDRFNTLMNVNRAPADAMNPGAHDTAIIMRIACASDRTANWWPTPSARDWKDTPGMKTTREKGKNRADQLARVVYVREATLPKSGTLNPTFPEWLMGFPFEWTVCDALATPSSRNARSKSSATLNSTTLAIPNEVAIGSDDENHTD